MTKTISINELKRILTEDRELKSKSKFTLDDTKMTTVDELAERVNAMIEEHRGRGVVKSLFEEKEFYDEKGLEKIQQAVDNLKSVITEDVMDRHMELEKSITDAVKEIDFIKKTQGDSLKTILDFLDEGNINMYVIEKLGSKIGPLITARLNAAKAKVNITKFANTIMEKAEKLKQSGEKLSVADRRFVEIVDDTMGKVLEISEESISRTRMGNYYAPGDEADPRTGKTHLYTVENRKMLKRLGSKIKNIWQSITQSVKRLLTRGKQHQNALEKYANDLIDFTKYIVNDEVSNY